MVLVANAASRKPFMSVSRSYAPGCGRSSLTIMRMPWGQPVEVQQVAGLSDPRAVPDLAVWVGGRRSDVLGDQGEQVGKSLGDVGPLNQEGPEERAATGSTRTPGPLQPQRTPPPRSRSRRRWIKAEHVACTEQRSQASCHAAA